MLITPKKGEIVINETICLAPFSDLSFIEYQYLKKGITIKHMSEAYTSVIIKNLKVGDDIINLSLSYHQKMLHSFSFVIVDENTDAKNWGDWDETKEKSKVDVFNNWLNKHFSEKRNFSWGKVLVYYDSRSASTGISVNYHIENKPKATSERSMLKKPIGNSSMPLNKNIRNVAVAVKPMLKPTLKSREKVTHSGEVKHSITIRFVEETFNEELTRKKISERNEINASRHYETTSILERDPNWKWIYANSLYHPEDDCSLFILHDKNFLMFFDSILLDNTILDILKKLDGREVFNEYDDTIFEPKEILTFTAEVLAKSLYRILLGVDAVNELKSLQLKCKEAVDKGYYLKGIKRFTT